MKNKRLDDTMSCERPKADYAAQLRSMAINQEPTQEIEIEGVGTVKLFGEWDAEKLIKRLLQSDSITG